MEGVLGRAFRSVYGEDKFGEDDLIVDDYDFKVAHVAISIFITVV